MEISPLERVEAVFYTGEGMVSVRVWSSWEDPRSHLPLHAKLTRTTEINLLEGELQQSVNAKFKLKHTQELKIWQGLDLKLSSTVTYETLQRLASQTEQARQEMLQIQRQKEEMDRSYKEQLYSYDTTIKEKDSLIKQLEDSLDENKSRLICLDSRFQCMEQQLKLKDDVCISLKGNLASSESEKNSLELTNKQHILEIEELCQDNKDLKKLLGNFVVKVTALDKELASVSSHVARLISSFERFYEMAQEEKMLMARSSKDEFEHLQIQHADLMSESNALRTETEYLMSRLRELQRSQETMAEHVEECQVAEEKIRRLESEATSNINLHEKLASELQGIIHRFLGQEQSIMEENSNNAESLQGEIIKSDPVNRLENLINMLRIVLDEKEQLYRRSVERQRTLEEQKSQVEASLSAAECQLIEAKNKYDLMLSNHLKELSCKHDQAFNEIHKKYELEKIEITNAEKEKAEKLIDAEQKITSARQEMLQIQQQKEDMDRSYKERLYSYDTTIKEKDSLIKQLEDSLDENKSRLICLDSRFQCMEQELKLKDDVCISLKGNLASSESEKNSLELKDKQHILEIEELCQDNKDLKKLLGNFVVKVTALDKELASVSSHVARLISSFERFYEMAQEEKMLMARSSKDEFEHLQIQHADLMSESNALRTETEYLMSRLRELQRTQETMAEHVEECQVAEEKVRRLESEATSNINLHEKLASELQGIIHRFLGDSKGEITNDPVNTLENQINLLRNVLDEKQLYRRSVEREKTLKDQNSHVEASLSAADCQLSEAKEKYDLMLSENLKELSRKHDKAINEIRKKYELEKIEITNAEKEKAEKLISETENKCNRKISQLKEEHGTMVERIQQDNEHKESILWAYYNQELQRVRSQAENELRKEDNIWDKRQLMYLFVLTSTVGLAFLLQPLLPTDYSRWIIMTIAAVWGIGSIGFPCGLYGTSRCEKDCSRYTGRGIYTVFTVFVIYVFYLLAMRSGDISDPMRHASVKKDDSNITETVGFCSIGVIVLVGNIWSSIRGCWTGGDRDP